MEELEVPPPDTAQVEAEMIEAVRRGDFGQRTPSPGAGSAFGFVVLIGLISLPMLLPGFLFTAAGGPWLPATVTVAVLGLARLAAVTDRSWLRTLSFAVALSAGLVGMAFGQPWLEVLAHDRQLASFVDEVCNADTGQEVTSCRGEVRNEWNGNHCDYVVVLHILGGGVTSIRRQYSAVSNAVARVAVEETGSGHMVTLGSDHRESDIRCW